ncbi:MAG: hypothetical protein HY909_06020 [Deltaproteobacteria bacterium]|nr:hypothetical protein [Deltaproteobacteria bacterium]
MTPRGSPTAPAALLVVALGVLAPGCAALQHRPTEARRRAPPDVHGEPLALLPAGAVAWLRLDLEALRRSPHWEPSFGLWRAEAATLQRELGFEALQDARVLAMALYLPPGHGAAGWPVFYARGTLRREAILAAARARNDGQAGTSGTEAGLAYQVLGSRAYLFPAPDVVLVLDRGLLRRVASRLSGEAEHSIADDPRFEAHWRRAGDAPGSLRGAVDLASLRAHGTLEEVRMQGGDTRLLDSVVVGLDAPEDVRALAVGSARDATGAREVLRVVDAARSEAAGQWVVHLLGLNRVLGQGIQARSEDRWVIVRAEASRAAVGRLLRVAGLTAREVPPEE